MAAVEQWGRAQLHSMRIGARNVAEAHRGRRGAIPGVLCCPIPHRQRSWRLCEMVLALPHGRRLWRRWNFVAMTHGKMTGPTGNFVAISGPGGDKNRKLTTSLPPA